MPTRRTFLLSALTAALAGACGKPLRPVLEPAGPTTTSGPAADSGPGGAVVPAAPSAGAPGGMVPPPGTPAAYIPHGPRTSNLVALTFHGSGDPALTDELLAQAAQLKAPITVFAVGQWLQQHPEIAGKILAAGHELANHTYSHPSLGQLGRGSVAQEITRCRDVLVSQAGNTGDYFRPSGVSSTPSALILEEAGKAGYATSVGFDVDPLDYTDPAASTITGRVKSALQPGSIVSLHLGHANTVAAFGPIVSAVRGQGLTPVLVRDVLP